jgi:hypothetical protein
MYRVAVTNGVVSLTTPVANGGASWGPASRPLMVSPGDTDADQLPELYSLYPSSNGLQLWQNEIATLSTTDFSISTHSVIDDGAGAIDWTAVTALS